MEYLINFIWFWNVWQSDTIGCCVWIAKQLLNQFSFKMFSWSQPRIWIPNYDCIEILVIIHASNWIGMGSFFWNWNFPLLVYILAILGVGGWDRQNLENSRFLWSYRVEVFSWKTKSYKRQNQVNRHLSCLYVMLSSMKMFLFFTTNAGLAWVKNCHFIFTLKVVCW